MSTKEGTHPSRQKCVRECYCENNEAHGRPMKCARTPGLRICVLAQIQGYFAFSYQLGPLAGEDYENEEALKEAHDGNDPSGIGILVHIHFTN